MIISDDTKRVIEYLQMISEDNLRKSKDLSIMLEVGATYSQNELIQSLIFTGKSIWNLSKTIARSIDTIPNDNLKREFEANINEFREMITQIIDYVDEEDANRFYIIYLNNDLGATRNIIDLAHDLSIMKDIQKKM
jgi:hypothetical protein